MRWAVSLQPFRPAWLSLLVIPAWCRCKDLQHPQGCSRMLKKVFAPPPCPRKKVRHPLFMKSSCCLSAEVCCCSLSSVSQWEFSRAAALHVTLPKTSVHPQWSWRTLQWPTTALIRFQRWIWLARCVWVTFPAGPLEVQKRQFPFLSSHSSLLSRSHPQIHHWSSDGSSCQLLSSGDKRAQEALGCTLAKQWAGVSYISSTMTSGCQPVLHQY